MKLHLDRADLLGLTQALAGDRRLTNLGHLLTCEQCRSRLQQLSGSRDVGARVLPFSGGRGSATARFEQRWAQTLDRGERERERAEALFAELLRQPQRRRRVLIQNCERFLNWGLAARLLAESRETTFADTEGAADLARLGLEIAGRLDIATYGERLVRDLSARAWGTLGNALRLSGDLEAAGEAFDRAAELLEGTLDPLERAEWMQLLSSLRRLQRRFPEALALLEEAGELYASAGETRMLARTWTKRGLVLLEKGVPEQALEPLETALGLVDALGDPRTAMAIHQNLAFCFVELERWHDAARAYAATRKFRHRFQDRWTQLRSRWLEALIAAGSGRGDEAEAQLTEVRRAYGEAGQDYEAAMVALDLALLYSRQGRAGEVRRLAEAMAPVFFSRAIHREAATALSFFRQAVEREQATVEVVHRVAAFLRRSRRNPALTFDCPSV